MKRIAIIDGSNLIFRAFFAVPTLNTRDGQATNALFGSLKSFRGIVQDLKPDYIVIGWDSGGKTFRHQMDPTYKAHRPPVQDDLKSQFSMVKDAFAHLKIPQIVAPPGMENDDLLGTLAKKASESGYEAFIVSSDKDFYQLCTDTLKVYSFTVKKKNNVGIVDADYVRQEYKCEPSQLVDIKALTGERCDGIKGVAGIGPKTALNLITAHKTVHKMIKYMAKNPTDKLAVKINENIPVIENAYKLAMINTEVDLPDDIPIRPVSKIVINERDLWDFFENYELRSMLDSFHDWTNIFNYAVGV